MTTPGLFLIGHGTRSEKGVRQFLAFCDAIAAARPGTPVGRGFIELVEPELQEGIDRLVAEGVDQIIGIPLVLFGAGHMKDDGPVAMAKARTRHPGLATAYGRELGTHPLVLAAVEKRARQADPGPADAVIVVGRGSSDPDANADLAKAARLLADSRGLGEGLAARTAWLPGGGRGANRLGLVEPAFVSLAAPTVADALDHVHRLGARRITVVPYFLFAGVLIDRIVEQAAAWAADIPGVAVSYGREIGVAGGLVDLVWRRYDETRGSPVAMNCDGCIYRAPLPGYEAKVGAPPFG